MSGSGPPEAAVPVPTEDSKQPPLADKDRSNDPPAPASDAPDQGQQREKDSTFECNICLDTATEPVTTLCGHLFCWPCLFEWVERARRTECPVCKAGVSKENVIPLYGRGKQSDDPRKRHRDPNIPTRPQGQRPEAAQRPRNSEYHDFGFGFGQSHFGGVSFSAGVGFLPLFSMSMWGNNAAAPPGTREEQQQQMLSRLLLVLGMMLLFFLVSF